MLLSLIFREYSNHFRLEAFSSDYGREEEALKLMHELKNGLLFSCM